MVQGYVFSEETKQPIQDVEIIESDSTSNVVVTDSSGGFTIYLNHKKFDVRHVSYTDQSFDATKFVNGSRIFLVSGFGTMLDQTVIGADKVGRALKNQIVSVESVNPQIITDKNPVNMDEIVDQVPGVVISDGQINIRNGAGWSYGSGTRALVVVDGMPLISADAGKVQWNFLPVDNIRNMEVVKGASSVLYGSAALNGMINIRTSWPSQKSQTKITGFYGGYANASRSTLDWSDKKLITKGIRVTDLRRKKKHDFVTTAEIIQDDGYRFGDYEDRSHIGLDYRYRANDKLELGIRTHLLSTSNGSFLLWKSYDSAYSALNDQTTHTDGMKFRVDPFLTYITKKGWSHNIKSRYFSIDNQVDNGDTSVDQSNQNAMYYVDYQSTIPIKRNFKFIYGTSLMSVESNSPLFNGSQTASNVAFYAQIDHKWKRLSYVIGARREKYTLNDYEEAKPVFRMGMNYRVTKATYLRLSYGQGYRFPTIGESYIKTNVGVVAVYPNQDLKSETGDNLEVGLKQGFKFKKAKGFIDVALFKMTYQNMMEFTFGQWSTDISQANGFGLGFKSLNTGSTQISGIDISMLTDINLFKGNLQIFGGYTSSLPVVDYPDLSFATDSTGNKLSYRNTSSNSEDGILKYRSLRTFKMDFAYKKNRFNTGLSVRYSSQIQNIDKAFVEGILPLFVTGIKTGMDLNPNGYWVADFRIGYRITSKYRIAFVINNIGNVEYMVRPADIGAPRMGMIQLRANL